MERYTMRQIRAVLALKGLTGKEISSRIDFSKTMVNFCISGKRKSRRWDRFLRENLEPELGKIAEISKNMRPESEKGVF